MSPPGALGAEYTETVTVTEIKRWGIEDLSTDLDAAKWLSNTIALVSEYWLLRKNPLLSVFSPRYGNWYGPGWWGGSTAYDKPGDEPPINSLDMIAMAHDMAYGIAEEKGREVDNKEKYLLLALADKYCLDEVGDLPINPYDWRFPPSDLDLGNAGFYAEAMQNGFVYNALLMQIKSAISEAQVYRKLMKLLTPDEFRELRDARVQEWITQKEKKLAGEVSRLKSQISDALSKYSKNAKDLCSSMEEKERLARQHASSAMLMAQSLETQFSSAEKQLSQCAVDEEILIEALDIIDPASMQMEDALRNAKRFATSCKSETDAEKALGQYKEAERYLKRINENYEKIKSKIRSVEMCRGIFSSLSTETKRVLSESDKALAVKESAINYRNEMKAMREEREQLQSRCGHWTSRIREYGWSDRIIETLGNEIGGLKSLCDISERSGIVWPIWSDRIVRNLGIDVSRFRIPTGLECNAEDNWDRLKQIETEARNARAIVRRLSRVIEKDEEFRDDVTNNLKMAENVRNIRDKAVFTMSAHSNIPQMIAECRSDMESKIREAIQECKFQEADAYLGSMSESMKKKALQVNLAEARSRAHAVYTIYQEGKTIYDKGRNEEASGRHESAEAYYRQAHSKFQQAKNMEICKSRLPTIDTALSSSQNRINQVSRKPARQPEKTTQRFDKPMVGSVPMDGCLHWAKDCGKPAADHFCRINHFAEATGWDVDVPVKQSRVITSGKVCETGVNWPRCGAFTYIVCQRQSGTIVTPPSHGSAGTQSDVQQVPSTHSARMGPQEPDTDRPGSDYRSFNLPSPEPGLCRAACEREAQCKAYTYVKPGHQASSARCWLKHSVPKQSPNKHCISGVKQ
jgi:tetratricopeptide (TPR) repeat protein